MKSKASFAILALAVVAVIFISGCVEQPTVPPSDKIVFIVSAELPEATESVPYKYSFCSPEVASISDICGDFEETTNPTGGNPPYYFSLGSGVGFPPLGITLNNNGLLAGTPTAVGTSTFQVCAVDEGGRQACQTVSLTVKPISEQREEEVSPSVKIESASAIVDSCTYTVHDTVYVCSCTVKISGTATLPYFYQDSEKFGTGWLFSLDGCRGTAPDPDSCDYSVIGDSSRTYPNGWKYYSHTSSYRGPSDMPASGEWSYTCKECIFYQSDGLKNTFFAKIGTGYYGTVVWDSVTLTCSP